MNFTELYEAINDAESTVKRADDVAERMARLLVGRLRKVPSCHTLHLLKKELRKFNSHTGKWTE